MSSTPRTRIHSIGFQLKTLSLAVASALLTFNASAAGLGDLKVHSYLGQPLRAEVELISMPSDSDAPMIKLASQDLYQKANVEFSPLLLSLRFSTEQRGDRKVVRITSTQPINEPFVDMLLELKSNNNSVVREYVFLLDPASLISAPVVALDDEAATRAAAQSASAPRTPPVAQAEKTTPPVRRSAPKKSEAAQTPAEKTASPSAAGTGKPRLSLSSPRLLSGADDDTARSAAKEFAAMEQAVAEANARVVALEQKVTDMQKLLEVTNSLLTEMQRQRTLQQANAAAAPVAPDAIKATAAPATATPSMSSPAESNPASAVATPAPAPAPVAAVATVGPATTATAAAPAKPAQAAQTPVAPAQDEDWNSDLLLLPGVALLLAGLGAVGLRFARRRKPAKPFEDSLFAASTHGPHTERQPGGAFTTNLTNLFPSTTNSDEVDTVAEADVYIAYGRDGQAEDLLKEALRRKPGNRAVSMKLLSIYATRKDTQSFEPLARDLNAATNGDGDDWMHIAEMGRGIDPANPLYAAKQAASVSAPAANHMTDARKAIILDTPADDTPELDELLELGRERAEADAAPASPPASTTLTDEEEQLAELLSHPLAELDAKTEAPVAEAEAEASLDAAAMDVDLALKQLDEPVFHALTPEDEARQEAGIGPIDFEAIVPDIHIEQKEEAVPQIPHAALEASKAGTNLIEFDFLQPASDSVSDDLPEIPLALPVENEGTDEEAKLFKLEFLDEKSVATTKR